MPRSAVGSKADSFGQTSWYRALSDAPGGEEGDSSSTDLPGESASSPDAAAADTRDASDDSTAAAPQDSTASASDTSSDQTAAATAHAVHASPIAGTDQAVADVVDAELAQAVTDKYGKMGLTVGDLRTHLEVALDIEDALDRGHTPRLDPARYATYKRVHALVMGGGERTEAQEKNLQELVFWDVMALPWPSPVKRAWLKRKGWKLPRLKRSEATMYVQGYLTEALLPFDSEEDLEAHLTGKPSLEAVGSRWGNEVDAETLKIQRAPARAHGSSDQADIAALIDSALRASDQSSEPSSESGNEGPGRATEDEVQQLAAPRGDVFASVVGASGASVREAGGANADKLKALDEAAAAAVRQGVFDEQEASLLRGQGYKWPDQVQEFREELGFSVEEWKEWVEFEVERALKQWRSPSTDARTPDEVLESVVPEKQRIDTAYKPAYNIRDIAREHRNGPFAKQNVLPEWLSDEREERHPAAEQQYARAVVEDAMNMGAYSNVFTFEQTMWLHFGPEQYHPGNKRVSLKAHMATVAEHYGLCERGVKHVVELAGPRFNPRTGMLKISCSRNRDREDNRRQALHWFLRLVESALLEHPTDAWEARKAEQQQHVQRLSKLAEMNGPARL